MINEETNVLETPYNLVTLSQVTGNPMLDLGYQCCDMRPYFEYKNGNNYCYTNIHPINISSQIINVYQKRKRIIDRVEWDSMKYIGTTTNTSSNTIIYNDTTYTFTGVVINIRGFFINKWSLVKPISSNVINELNKTYVYPNTSHQREEYGGEFKGSDTQNDLGIIYGLKAGTNTWNNLHNCAWAYVGLPNPSKGDWFRMLDFNGYNSKAKPSLYGYSEVLNNIKKLYVTDSKPFEFTLFYNGVDGTNVDVLKCVNTNVNDIKRYYPCVLISKEGVSLEDNLQTTWCRALLNKDNDKATSLYWTNELGEEVESKYYYCPEFNESIINLLVNKNTGKGGATITLFLADLDYIGDLNGFGVSDGQEIKTDWFLLGNEVGDQVVYPIGISIPEVAGIELFASDSRIDFSYAEITNVFYDAIYGNIKCILTFSNKVESPRYYFVNAVYIQKIYSPSGPVDEEPQYVNFDKYYYGGNDSEELLGVELSFFDDIVFISKERYKIKFEVIGKDKLENPTVTRYISEYEGEIIIP